MASVRLDRVFKRYGTVEAVKDLTLACPDGELLALLGPSGCGKTSTLKMIAGIEAVSEGEIYFDDRPVSELAPGQRDIAMVFEDYALYPHLSVAENIAFPLRVRRVPTAEIRRAVHATTQLLGLEAVRDANVRSLSGGAQQRVSIGRAMVRNPELMLFDEPLSHLDGDQKVQLRGEIKHLQQETGLTSILVTHDQTEAMAMSDRVAVMSVGILQQVGSPEDVYDRPANVFVASFIGEPPMNLLPGRLAQEAGTLWLRGDGWQVPAPAWCCRERLPVSGRVMLGVRPEHVELRPAAAGSRDATTLFGRVFHREPRGDVEVVLVEPNGRASGTRKDAGTEGLLTVEVTGPGPWREDDLVLVQFREGGLHVFDAETGQNVARAGG